MLHDEFEMDPERVMGMPFVRFMAWQALRHKRSVDRRNDQLRRDAERGMRDEG